MAKPSEAKEPKKRIWKRISGVRVGGNSTSIVLEDEFCEALMQMAANTNVDPDVALDTLAESSRGLYTSRPAAARLGIVRYFKNAAQNEVYARQKGTKVLRQAVYQGELAEAGKVLTSGNSEPKPMSLPREFWQAMREMGLSNHAGVVDIRGIVNDKITTRASIQIGIAVLEHYRAKAQKNLAL